MMGIGRHLGWGGGSSLSEVTSIQLEFRDISRCTENNTYEKIAFKASFMSCKGKLKQIITNNKIRLASDLKVRHKILNEIKY